ncbi:MAG: GxxExxY protein [Sphingomonadaceae bacterium]
MKDSETMSGDGGAVALQLHRDLGPDRLGSVYETVLAGRLQQMGYFVERQTPVDIEFEGLRRLVNDFTPSVPLRELN